MCDKWYILTGSSFNIFKIKVFVIFVVQICDNMKTFARRMYDKPNTIEELTELREWMKTVPEKLTEVYNLLEKLKDDHVVLEDYFYSLSNEDFGLK